MMSKCELAIIFDDTVSDNGLVEYDEAFAYIQKQRGRPSKPKRQKKPSPPSQQAVKSFYAGDKKSIEKLATTFLYRSVLIGSALYLFGDRRSLVKNSLVASGSIEAFLLYWYKVKHK
jgi:hypothetical protein